MLKDLINDLTSSLINDSRSAHILSKNESATHNQSRLLKEIAEICEKASKELLERYDYFLQIEAQLKHDKKERERKLQQKATEQRPKKKLIKRSEMTDLRNILSEADDFYLIVFPRFDQ